MDSIVGYKSDDEQDSDGEHKYRDSNHRHSNTSSSSTNRRSTREPHDREKYSPDRRRKESKAESSHSDRNTSSSRYKSDKRDDYNRSRNDWERPRDDRDRDRRFDNRDRDDRRRDRNHDRHNRQRDYRGRDDRDRRRRSRSSSRDRYGNNDSPIDKREKDRRRYSSQSSYSQEKNSSGSSSRNSSSAHTQDASYTPNKPSRESDVPTNSSKDQTNTNVVTATDIPYQSPVTATTVDSLQPQQLKSPAETSSSVLPSYYNPNIINPNKYAEQVQKRKLIWGNKKSEDTASKWGNAKFSQDTDGKVASKFMRLMGIKDKPKSEDGSEATVGSESINKQEEMFSSMEQQYEVARQVTHTMRGVGLGFGSQPRPY